MGLVDVKLKISNLKDEKKFWEGKFLVDSGANYTVLPERVWKKLKLKPSWQQEFSLADGRIVRREIGNALIEYKDRKSAAPVVLGKKHDALLMGAITLEALGFSLHPFQRKIYESKLMMASFTTSTT